MLTEVKTLFRLLRCDSIPFVGGYYFGSIDQERYNVIPSQINCVALTVVNIDLALSVMLARLMVVPSVWLFRSSGVRAMLRNVLAINYRLAPQYPFPCAVQDFLAACGLSFDALLSSFSLSRRSVLDPTT